MLYLNNISVSFGGQVVLDRLTWTVRPGVRTGLVGPNGAGKSTLLRVIAGLQHVDGGDVTAEGGTTVGYLTQDVQEMPGETTVLDAALDAFAEILSREDEVHALAAEMEAMDDHASAAYMKRVEALTRAQADLDRMEAHLIRPKTESVLSGLGFSDEDMARPLRTFSGGWRMRVALARLLLQNPSVLLLDEPTNHLDIESIDWLEGYLKSYPGAVVLVSHDRYFLDRMVTTIAELYGGGITEYAGNYAFYLEERKERRALQQAAYDNQQREIAQMERFVERFRAKATKAKQAQSRVKMLEKMERIPPPPQEESAIHFRFPEPPRSGRTVLSISEFSKSYPNPEGGTIKVFRDADSLEIERGDKIALIGKNGAGKSTLARILDGKEEFDGARDLGYEVQPAFFAQHQADTIPHELTALDALRRVAEGQSETALRSLLGAFLFTGDDVFKPVGVLSGGEKSRLALARTLLSPANFLILDEPTNHLDMASKAVLVEALRQYAGTFVVVSHDRHFLDQIVTSVWWVGNGGVRVYEGGYSDYLWQREQAGTSAPVRANSGGDGQSAAAPAAPKSTSKSSGGKKTKEQKRREAEERNRLYQALQNGKPAAKIQDPTLLRRLVEKLENEIAVKEEEKAGLEAKLAEPDFYQQTEAFQQTMQAFGAIESEMKDLMKRWEDAAAKLEAAEA